MQTNDKADTRPYVIIQDRYINNMLRIGRQNSIPDEKGRVFQDSLGNEYTRQNFIVNKSKVACAAKEYKKSKEVKIDALTLRVFYAACNYFFTHKKDFDSKGFVKDYTEVITPPSQKGQGNTLTRKRVSAQFQLLSKISLYLPLNKYEEPKPCTIGLLSDKALYTLDALSDTGRVKAIIDGFTFGDEFKEYLKEVGTFIKVPTDLLKINIKHNPHALTLILNLLIVADIKKRKKQSKEISTDKLLEYCPDLLPNERRARETIMSPIIHTLKSCAKPYFQSYFIDKTGNRIEKPETLNYKQWANLRLKIEKL